MRNTTHLLIGLFLALPAFAALPLEEYQAAITGSEIQAIAVGSDLQRTGEDAYSEKYEATFTIEKSISLRDSGDGKAAGGSFLGGIKKAMQREGPAAGAKLKVSYATLKNGSTPPPGFPITFEVRAGERVFATIGESGELTSYTPLTPKLEKALSEKPPRVKIWADRVEPKE